MNEIKLENLKTFISKNENQVINQFIESLYKIERNSFNKYNTENNEKNLLLNELIKFINYIISVSENEKDITKNVIEILNMNNIKDSDLESKLITYILGLNKRNLTNNLINHNWQLSIKERESNNNSNKMEKIEIAMQFNSYDLNDQNYKQNLIKMNYFEFNEIFQHLKNINIQLHLVKNSLKKLFEKTFIILQHLHILLIVVLRLSLISLVFLRYAFAYGSGIIPFIPELA